MNPYEAYVMYLAIKMHFTNEKYDYFKYNGKVKANPQSFDTRRDKYFFYKLSKKPDALNYIVANLVDEPNKWAGDLLNDKSERIYEQWLSYQQSLSYNFKLETQDLYPDFDSNIIVTNGHPPLYTKFRRNTISKETLIILDEIYNIFDYWNSKMNDPVLWPKDFIKLKKYKSFIRYDVLNYKKILKKHIDEYK